MDYEIDTTGSGDEVVRRETLRAVARYKGDPWQVVAPLVRVILALLAALGARSVREALERAASVNNPVRQAIEADDRATAERWARKYLDAAGCEQDADEGTIAAMLPLVREMREAVAAAHVEQSSAMAHVVAQIAGLFGLGEDEPNTRVIEVARALTAPVDVEEKVRAEGVAALRRWDEALIAMPSYTGDGDERQMAVVVRPLVEREARLVAALRAKAAAPAPAPLTEDEARRWGERTVDKLSDLRPGEFGHSVAVIGWALHDASRGDIPPEVRPAGDPHDHAPEDDPEILGVRAVPLDLEAMVVGVSPEIVAQERAAARAELEAADDAPDSVDPRDLPPDSEDPAATWDPAGGRPTAPDALAAATMGAPGRQCVAVLVTDPADRVLLVLSNKGGDRGWEFPGGKRLDGEDPREAVRREVREETGLDVVLSTMEPLVLPATATHRGALVFRGRAEGEPRPGSDATAARWWTAAEVRSVDFDDPTLLSDLASREVLVDWAHLPARREQVEASRAELPTTRLYREIREADVAAAEARLRFLEGS